jgi:RNA recognition motif-containing protein
MALPVFTRRCCRYGEVLDVHLPRDKETGKIKGFGFLMYEDQRSTVLAVDNLNGAKVLERTLRVDHVKNYKQQRTKDANGDWIEPEEQSLNAQPEAAMGASHSYLNRLLLTVSQTTTTARLRMLLRHLISILKTPCTNFSCSNGGRPIERRN